MRGGVITYVYEPYNVTDWTTDKYIWPEVQESAPSLISTLVSRTKFCRDLHKLMTIAGQFLSAAKITLPRHLKEVTGARGVL